MAENKEDKILEIEGSGELDDADLEEVAGGLHFNRRLMKSVLADNPRGDLKVTLQRGRNPFAIISKPGGGVFWGVGGCGVGG